MPDEEEIRLIEVTASVSNRGEVLPFGFLQILPRYPIHPLSFYLELEIGSISLTIMGLRSLHHLSPKRWFDCVSLLHGFSPKQLTVTGIPSRATARRKSSLSSILH